jgi:hypothetical protein
MKYKIILGGKGGENYIHKPTSDQYEQLSQLDLESAYIDDILPILEKDDIFETDDIILGSYTDSDCVYIEVYDESETKVWSSDENGYLDSDYEEVYVDNDYLVVQDYVKGQFKYFEIDCNEFDGTKLKLKVKSIGYDIDIVTGLIYDESELEVVDFGDYWSKGFSFFLI